MPTDPGSVVEHTLVNSLSTSIGARVGSTTDDIPPQERGVAYVVGGVGHETLGEKVTIGKAELVRSWSLLVPQDGVANISVRLPNWAFSLEITFENAEGGKPSIQLVPKRQDAAHLTFLNWNSTFGISLAVPLEIVYLKDGSKILLLAANQAIGRTNRLELQLLLQGKS